MEDALTHVQTESRNPVRIAQKRSRKVSGGGETKGRSPRLGEGGLGASYVTALKSLQFIF